MQGDYYRYLAEVMEKIIAVGKPMPQRPWKEIVDAPVPEIQEQIVEVVKVMFDAPWGQVAEEPLGVASIIPPESFSELVEQMVDVQVPGVEE